MLDLHPGNYPNYGLSHTLAELESVRPIIMVMTRKEQAQYADAITKKYAKDRDFVTLMLLSAKEHIEKEDYRNLAWIKSLNTTAFGNMAYMAENAEGIDREYFAIYHAMVTGTATKPL